jgi:hypothetical protein
LTAYQENQVSFVFHGGATRPGKTNSKIRWYGFRSIFVNHFISTKEAKSVREVFERLHNRKDTLQIVCVVRFCRFCTVQTFTVQRRVDIHDQIDACSIENGDAFVVIQGWVQVVDANRIYLIIINAMSFRLLVRAKQETYS